MEKKEKDETPDGRIEFLSDLENGVPEREIFGSLRNESKKKWVWSADDSNFEKLHEYNTMTIFTKIIFYLISETVKTNGHLPPSVLVKFEIVSITTIMFIPSEKNKELKKDKDSFLPYSTMTFTIQNTN